MKENGLDLMDHLAKNELIIRMIKQNVYEDMSHEKEQNILTR